MWLFNKSKEVKENVVDVWKGAPKWATNCCVETSGVKYYYNDYVYCCKLYTGGFNLKYKYGLLEDLTFSRGSKVYTRSVPVEDNQEFKKVNRQHLTVKFTDKSSTTYYIDQDYREPVKCLALHPYTSQLTSNSFLNIFHNEGESCLRVNNVSGLSLKETWELVCHNK